MKILVAAILLLTILDSVNYTSAVRRSRKAKWGRSHSRTKQFNVGETTSNPSVTQPEAPAPAPRKPTAADCTQAGFYPTPGSCLHFYRCVDWAGDGSFYSVFHFTCPAGTVFDDKLDTCNYPYAAGRPECADGTFQDGVSVSTTDSSLAGGNDSTVIVTEASSQSTPPDNAGGTFEGGVSVTTTDSSLAGGNDSTVIVTEASSQSPPPDNGTFSTESSDNTSVSSQPAIGDITVTEASIPTTVPTETTSPEVFTLKCYPDNKYRRHQLYCNQYYYCTNNGVWSIPIFTCPTGLIFDEANQICAREAEGLSPDCEKAPYASPITSTESGEEGFTAGEFTGATDATTLVPDSTSYVTDPTVDMTTQSNWELDPESIYDCPAPGYYPFEGDCIRFYKCVETDLSQLKGLLYRCPDGFGYSEDRQRCLKEEDLSPCQRVPQQAHLRVETATQLYPHDLNWFFSN